MAVLNDWQKLTRVLPGKPFGDGRDGALNISSNTTQTLTARSCSGTSGGNSLTLGSSGFADGDIVEIIQSRGTGVGQHEINKIASGGGTTSLTLAVNLQYTYTDSGASQAQIIKIPMYTTVSIGSGFTLTASAWDGDINGILLFAAKTGVSGAGNLSWAAKGYRGGAATASGANNHGLQGEGTTANGGALTTAANGTGGGGGSNGTGRGGGGGGGHSASGSTGGTHGGVPGGTGGGTGGSADLITAIFGGAGGSGASDTGGAGGAGGTSGGIGFIFTDNFALTGTTNGNGGDGGSAGQGGGGGAGTGGSALILCRVATLGSGLITASAGALGVSSFTANGGAASAGRIAVHHSGTITGTTTPTFTDVTDATLIELGGGGNFLQFF